MHPEGNTPNNQSQCHTDQPTPGRAESHEAGVSSLGVSATTQSLIDLLRRRDAAGRAKYGTTLDRTDLTGAEWTQHAVEELLDAAGYLLSRQRTDDQASAPAPAAGDAADGWQHLAADWLEQQAEEQEATNAEYPKHAAAYSEWRDRPVFLRMLAEKVKKAEGSIKRHCPPPTWAFPDDPSAPVGVEGFDAWWKSHSIDPEFPETMDDRTFAKAAWDAALAQQPAPSAPVGVEVASLPALWRQREDNGEERTEFDKGYEQASDECAEALERALAQQPTPPGPVTAKFTDSARAAIAWVLYHHQGAKSPVGQPLRYALGLGRHEPLSDFQIAEAQAWAAWANATTADFHRQQQGDQA